MRIRTGVCRDLDWFGIELDPALNQAGPDGKPQLVARQTFVTTGATRGDQVSELKGIKEGDEVVIAGQMKLRNGIGVVVNNTVIPSNDVNPKPVDQ